jgi:hypothetical protein
MATQQERGSDGGREEDRAEDLRMAIAFKY